jgi:hypothetical protein
MLRPLDSSALRFGEHGNQLRNSLLLLLDRMSRGAGPLSEQERQGVIAQAAKAGARVVTCFRDRTDVVVNGLITTFYDCGHVAFDEPDGPCEACATDRSREHARRVLLWLHGSQPMSVTDLTNSPNR